MKIEVRNHKPFLQFEVLGKNEKVIRQKFLLDTDCMASLVFPISTNSFEDLVFSSIQLLPEEKWVIVADGSRVETYTAKVSLKISKSFRTVNVILMASRGNTEPIIGMEFLEYYRKRLLLDFKIDKFEMT